MAEKIVLTAGGSTLALAGGLFLRQRAPKPRRTRRTYNSLPWLVIHASHNGQDLQVARLAAERIRDKGRQCILLPFDSLTFEQLVQTRRALFIISNDIDGCPSNHDAACLERLLHQGRVLSTLECVVLGLGGVGEGLLSHRVECWLRNQGARSRFVDHRAGDQWMTALTDWLLQAVLPEPEKIVTAPPSGRLTFIGRWVPGLAR